MSIWFPWHPNIAIVDTASERSTSWQEGTFCFIKDTNVFCVLDDGAWVSIDDIYVKKAGDTMTGKLTITPASGETALKVNKDIILKAGEKVIFDGV